VERRKTQPHCFSHSPFQSISHDGFAGRAPHGETHVRAALALFAEKKGREERRRVAGAIVIDAAEIG
jgi:hypothetical protein